MTAATSVCPSRMNNMPPLPMVHHLSPVHPPDGAEVLDLCVRNKSISPSYSYDYRVQSPSYQETYLMPKSPSAMSDPSDISSTENRDLDANFNCTKKSKTNRPFKAYPKDPLSIAFISTVNEHLLGKESSEAYNEFREKMLAQVRATHNSTNKNMRRIQSQNNNSGDPHYWEKRRKNNEAAKRSRDARKAKEDEIAIRCAFLEQENLQLKFRIAALENEIQRNQRIFYH